MQNKTQMDSYHKEFDFFYFDFWLLTCIHLSLQSGMLRKDGLHDGVPLLPLPLTSASSEKKTKALPSAKWMIMLILE